jgi:hypothetical protein
MTVLARVNFCFNRSTGQKTTHKRRLPMGLPCNKKTQDWRDANKRVEETDNKALEAFLTFELALAASSVSCIRAAPTPWKWETCATAAGATVYAWKKYMEALAVYKKAVEDLKKVQSALEECMNSHKEAFGAANNPNYGYDRPGNDDLPDDDESTWEEEDE